MDKEEVLKELQVLPRLGLTKEEAKTRLEKYGSNELKKEKKTSPLAIFLHQFKNILIIILLCAIALSAAIGEILDAVIIGIIVLFCALLGFVQEYRAERALEALKKMLSPTITVLRDGQEEEILTKEVVPGDVIVLEAGDRIPADARIIESYSLRCDESSLTGESAPVDKSLDSLPEDIPLGDRINMVFTGTMVTYGRGKAVVTATGMETEFGKIAEQVAAAEAKKTPLEKRTEEVGKWLGIISLSICFLVAGFSFARAAISGNLNLEFLIGIVMFAVSLAVAAVPEALAAIVTGTLAIGMHQMARRNALIRKMPAVETLGCITVICTDKTGTLTKGEMTIRKIFAAGMMVEVTGSGYEPKGDLKVEGDIGSDPSLRTLLLAGLLCNDASLEKKDGLWRIKGDPTEAALVVAAAKAGLPQDIARLGNPRVGEVPFSSERKRMTTIHEMRDGQRKAFMKGAPEIIIERCTYFLDRTGQVKRLPEEEKARILGVNENMASNALRVLGLAYRDLQDEDNLREESLERDLIFLGLVGMMDPPREEAIEAINVCKRVRIKPVMITGDHKLTALAIAREMGIHSQDDLLLTGEELGKISEEEFEEIVHRVTVYARVSPLDKLKIVKAWKKKGEVVAMTGDGVNDAPALKHADIGVSMGITGTEVTKEASDMVLNDDNFATIVKAIELGRWIYDNIKKYLVYLLRCNMTEVAVIGGAVLFLGPMYLPLLPAAILYINLATDGLPALALGVSPPDPDIMRRPPRDPMESVFSRDVRILILMALFIEVPFFYLLFFHRIHDLAQARTVIFFLFIIVEIIIALNFRSLRYSILKAPPHKWLLLAAFWELALISFFVHIPSLRRAFGILKPSAPELAIIAAFGLFVFLAMEVVKNLLRKKTT